VTLGRALGYPDTDDGLPSSIVVDTIEKTRELHSVARSMHRPSMLVDAEHGRPLEVEAILGELVRMGQERDVNMPVSFAVRLSRDRR
jgi:2-dehydropantoate 2-reductase